MNSSTLTQKLGRKIAFERRKAGMTQALVAEALDIGNEAVSRLERGLVEASVPRLMELAALFGYQTGDFFLDQSTLVQDQAAEIQALLNRINPTARRYAVEQLRHFVEWQEDNCK